MRRFTTDGIRVALTLAQVLAVPAFAALGPVPVSPGAQAPGAAVEARCPTFQWAGVPAAGGYELAVFRVSSDGAEPELVTRASVPGDARGWTPSLDDCLERGQRYAWSVAAAARAELAWSPPFLFEVEAAPSLDELEQAIATIDRYRSHHIGPGPARVDRAAVALAREVADVSARPAHPRRPRSAGTPDGVLGAAPGDLLPGALTAPTSGITRVASAADTPALGTPSLRVSANIALSAASNLFKDGKVFLWDDTTGNFAVGREALTSVLGTATNNTAVGRRALENTKGGNLPFLGSYNTAIGDGALRENLTGFSNTALGYAALFANTTGRQNTAIGSGALYLNSVGDGNTASGFYALVANTLGYYNTASGFEALRSNKGGFTNTASGAFALRSNTYGNGNTAIGGYTLYSNFDGGSNAAIGPSALFSNTSGDHNTASGPSALRDNTTGDRNTAVGSSAGAAATTGDDNIFVGSGATGVAGEGNTIRIGGTATGTGFRQQNRTFVNGIRGITTAANDAIPVLISSSTGQLGTASSSRAVKQDIQELGPLADRLLELRPVAFRYRQHAATDPGTPLQFGLIAEEVAEVFPELVVYDADGRPETIKYHLLSSLLLGELQRQHEEARRQREELQRQNQRDLEQRAEIQRLDARLELVERQDRSRRGRRGR